MNAFPDVPDDLVKSLVEGASWQDVGVDVNRLDESEQPEGGKVDEGIGFELDASKVGGKGGGKTPVMAGGAADKDHGVQDGSSGSEVNKATNEDKETHTCPLRS